MDGKEQIEKKKNPRESANPLSALTFAWILKTFWVGYQRDLEIEDLPRPLKEHKSDLLGEKISLAWEAELERVNRLKASRSKKKGNSNEDDDDKGKKKSKKFQPSLMRVLTKVFGFKIMLYGMALAIMEILLRLFQPLFLGLLIRYYTLAKIRYTSIHESTNIGDHEIAKTEDGARSLSP